MTFGERVKSARQKLGMSQQALAKELGVSFATVNRWEQGRNRGVDIRFLIKDLGITIFII